jgi:hypothetical protein
MTDIFKDDPRLSGKAVTINFCYDGPTFVRLDGVAIGVIGYGQKPESSEMGYRASGAGETTKGFDLMDDAVRYIVELYLATGEILEFGNYGVRK